MQTTFEQVFSLLIGHKALRLGAGATEFGVVGIFRPFGIGGLAHQAEEAANFYTSHFKNSSIIGITHYDDAVPGEKRRVLTVTFKLEGQDFIALNGGPQFTFNEAVSLFVYCETQEEVDAFWSKLSEGGEEGACGWLKDRYGLSWQIVPTMLMERLHDPDPVKAQRVFKTMLEMKTIDIAAIERAYEQAGAA